MPSARDQEMLESVAANVRSARERKAWTQSELAERADLDVRMVQRIEAATTNVTLVAANSIACALGIKVDRLLKPAVFMQRNPGRPKSKPRRSRSNPAKRRPE